MSARPFDIGPETRDRIGTMRAAHFRGIEVPRNTPCSIGFARSLTARPASSASREAALRTLIHRFYSGSAASIATCLHMRRERHERLGRTSRCRTARGRLGAWAQIFRRADQILAKHGNCGCDRAQLCFDVIGAAIAALRHGVCGVDRDRRRRQHYRRDAALQRAD
jgi:hypothetical protein